MANGTLLHPFENPADASELILFGVGYFLAATFCVRWAKKKELRGTSFSFDFSTWRPRAKVLTSEEMSKQLPWFFWPAIMASLRVFQIIGFAIICNGLLGLYTSISK